MALGGFKFAGRYCERGSLTDAQWAKRMHDCKLAAFQAANMASGNEWSIDETYSIDADGYNWYSRILYDQTGDRFYIYTLTKYKVYPSSSEENQGFVRTGLVFPQQSTGGNSSFGLGCTAFIRAGVAEADPSSAFGWPSGMSGLWPMGNWGKFQFNSDTTDMSNSYLNATKVYFGFAIRGSDIECFCKCGTQTNPAVSMASLGGFTSLMDSADAYNYFLASFQQPASGSTSGSESNAPYFNGTSMEISTPDAAGTQATDDWKAGLMAYPVTRIAGYTETLPFSTLSVVGRYNSSNPLIYGKGTINAEMLAINNYTSGNTSSMPSPFSTVANGKYLAVRRNTSSQAYEGIGEIDVSGLCPVIYIGWDPSNPDILQDSAWTLYDGT